ncbi:class I SAM-dependent methyltransferase [Nitrospira sp. Kam-Ns4a]
MQFDQVDPAHRGPNTVHLTRVQVARLIRETGCRRVLDLPCGTGELTHFLLESGIEVVSADINPEGFVIPGRPCVPANLNEVLPFDDGEFDGFACLEGIEHIENPHLLAREANRVLKLGGKIFISTPNVLSIRSRLSYLLRGYPDQFHYMIEVDKDTGVEQPVAHINPIGYLELRYTLSRWGFRVDAVETNRYLKRGSLLYRLIRAILMTRGKRAAAASPHRAEVRRVLLSDAVLFGEGLIVGATKVMEYQK